MQSRILSSCAQPFFALFLALTTPALSSAQAVLTGTVTAPSGASAIAVTVQVEGRESGTVRTMIADAAGRFRFEGLRSGRYDVTARGTNLKTSRLTGIELAGSRGTVVSIRLEPGSPQEVVVTSHDGEGEGRQSVVRQMSLDRALLRDLPTIRSLNSFVSLVPGVTTNSNDVVFEPALVSFPIFGGRPLEGRLTIDGTPVITGPDGGQAGHYIVGGIHEVELTTSGRLGEAENAGVLVNIVPREGGNVFRASLDVAGNSAGMVRDNMNDDLRAAGVFRTVRLGHGLDVEAGAGGPLRADRLWYFFSGRQQRNEKTIVNVFGNRNAGNGATLLYQVDFSQPAYSDRTWENVSGRLTFRVGESGRLSVLHDEQAICARCSGATDASGLAVPGVSPEAQGVGEVTPLRYQQATWNTSIGDRAFVDAGVSRYTFNWGNSERDGNARSLARATDTALGVTYRSQDWAENDTASTTWQVAFTRTFGGHVLKAGHQALMATDDRTSFTNDQAISIRLSSGFPNLITQVISPFSTSTRLSQLSGYVQDSWTAGRLTLHGAARFDRARSWFPEQRLAPTRWRPFELTLPRGEGVNAFTDVAPRVGGAYDASGDGRTVVRVTAGRYLEGASTTGIYADGNRALGVVRTATRSWNDLNRNSVPDCDLMNLFPSGECGASTGILNGFGTLQPTTMFSPDSISGFGNRPSDWSAGASVDRRLAPRTTVELSYQRRWFGGFTVVDNILVPREGYTAFTVNVPVDPQRPSGGTRAIGPIYDVIPSAFGRIQRMVAPTESYGKQTLSTDAVVASLNGRPVAGLDVRGGASASRTASDSCAVREAVPESALHDPFCRVSSGYLVQFRGLATYAFAASGIHVGAVYQNKPGPALSGIRFISNAAIIGSLGRPLAGNVAAIPVNVIEPGTQYGERIDQLDVRVSKVFRIGRREGRIGLDIFNALNGASPLAYSSTLFFSEPLPTSVITPRLFRIAGSFDF